MTDKELKFLYLNAYTSKDASEYSIKTANAWEDFITWLQELFGYKKPNSFIQNAAATGAGILGTAGAAYGGYKGYKSLQNFADNLPQYNDLLSKTNQGKIHNFVNSELANLARKDKDIAAYFNARTGAPGALRSLTPEVRRKGMEAAERLRKRVLAKGRFADSTVGKDFASGMRYLKRMPRWGKGIGLGLGALAAGYGAGKIYDETFN